MDTSIPPPTLGAFGILPPELRLHIWEFVIKSAWEPLPSGHGIQYVNTLNLLLTSKKINAEALPILYDTESFRFRVGEWTRARCSSGGLWDLDESHKVKILRWVPYERLRKIKIKICHRCFQSQLMGQMSVLANLFAQSRIRSGGLNNVEVRFCNTLERRLRREKDESKRQQMVDDILDTFSKF